MKTPIIGLVASMAILVALACGDGEDPLQPHAESPVDHKFMAAGAVRIVLDNRGIIGQHPAFPGGVGLFPVGSPNNYLFGSGLWVGGLVRGVRFVATAYNDTQGTSEFAPGRAAANGGGADRILCSNNPADLAQWYAEFRDSLTGGPRLVGDQDCVVIYSDSSRAENRPPSGLEVRQRVVAFTSRPAWQAILVIWDIVNTGSETIEEAFIAVIADMDVGSDYSDDRCSAIPLVPPGPNNPTGGTLVTNIGFCWDDDFSETSFNSNPPGFVGVSFLQGPEDAGGAPPATRFTLRETRNFGHPIIPETDSEQYDLLAGVGARAPFIDAIQRDQRFLLISGPVSFEPGRERRVVVAYLWANLGVAVDRLYVDPGRCLPEGRPCYLPDPNDPVLAELVSVQQAAQAVTAARLPALAPRADDR